MSNKHGSKWIRREKRLAIYQRDNFQCVYCLRNLADVPDNMRTLDHILPRVFGGGNGENNLVTCCLTCNSSRQDTDLTQFAPGGVIERIYRQIALPLIKNNADYRQFPE